MTEARAAGEVLAQARASGGARTPRLELSPSAPLANRAARAPHRPAPLLGAAPERARPGLDGEGRPLWMEVMQIPLTGLPDSVLARLDRLGRGYEGWGREPDFGPFFVDVGGVRFRGTSLHRAISAALGGAR